MNEGLLNGRALNANRVTRETKSIVQLSHVIAKQTHEGRLKKRYRHGWTEFMRCWKREKCKQRGKKWVEASLDWRAGPSLGVNWITLKPLLERPLGGRGCQPLPDACSIANFAICSCIMRWLCKDANGIICIDVHWLHWQITQIPGTDVILYVCFM